MDQDQKEKETVSQKVDRFFDAQDKVDELERLLTLATDEYESVKIELIDQMEEEGVKSIKDSKGRMVYTMAPKLYASIRAGMKEDAYRLIREEWNMGEYITDFIPPQTMSRMIKERIEKGDSVPDALFNYYLKRNIGARRNQNGKK